jgi:hypothetical protein
MFLKSHVTKEEVLAVLNSQPPSVAEHRAFLARYVAAAPPDALSGSAGWQLPQEISKREAQAMGRRIVSKQLRNFVDQWLSTGMGEGGTEYPGRRDFRAKLGPRTAITRYLRETEPRTSVLLGERGFEIAVTVDAFTWDKPWAGNFFQAQEIAAIRLWVGIVASDWALQLCRCRYSHCGQYFIAKKNLRTSYRRGTFCDTKHARAAAAALCTEEARLAGFRSLIKAAGRFLIEWRAGPSWPLDPMVKRQLAERLSVEIARQRLHRYREEVKLNWVTRNQAVIEQSRITLLAPS